MSIFHFPRINVNGFIVINVGTCNNDDYYGSQFPSGNPNAPQPVRLADSVNVQPMTYGMDDETWISWALTPLQVYTPPQQFGATARITKAEGNDANSTVLPCEWNYYGDMGLTMQNVNVTGITDPDNQVPDTLKKQLQSGQVSFNNRPDSTGRSTGIIIDINPEDVNSSQIFSDFLSLASGGQFLFSGQPSKATTRWVNFFRNTQLGGSNGAAGTFQVTVPLSALQGQPILAALPATSPEGAALAGLVFRFTLFAGMQEINTFKYTPNEVWIQKMQELYKTQGMNPHNEQLQGTIAPWYEGEPESCPVGRILYPTGKIPPPPNYNGNGPTTQLNTALIYVNQKSNVISVDFSATFPENYQGDYTPFSTDNPKWNFGTANLVWKSSTNTVSYAVNYNDMTTNDANGWIFDFPFDPTQPAIKDLLANGTFSLECNFTYTTPAQTVVTLQETPYFIMSDQPSVYAEQSMQSPIITPATTFRYDGADTVPISFDVYKNGSLVNDPTVLLNLYYYDTTPNPSAQTAAPILLQKNYVPGSPITLPVPTPGNRLITATLSTDPPPPAAYGNFNSVTSPIINVRILPYDNYSAYYQDPTAAQPVGNDTLTFEVIYNEVLRNYYLLYPAMNQRIALNDPDEWDDAEMAGRLLQRISLDAWGTAECMPRTRDLSQSRRELLTAWGLTYFQNTQ